MSTLVVDNLNDGTSSGSTTDMINGSARAWVNFNGTGTVAIRASYNVSSITDNGTGDYTVNFTNAMPDTNYSYVGSGMNLTYSVQGDDSCRTPMEVIGTRTINSIRLMCKFVHAYGAGLEDWDTVNIVINR